MGHTGATRMGAGLAAALIAVGGVSLALLGCSPATQTQQEDPGMGEVLDPQATEEQGSPAWEGEPAVQAEGYSLSVGDVRVDDSGLGAASFVLSNPDGLGGTLDETGGFVADAGQAAIDAVQLRVGNDQLEGRPNMRFVVDEGASTDTELYGTAYFDTRGTADPADGVFCQLVWHAGAEAPESQGQTSQPLETKAVDTRAFADGSGATAELSELGVTLSAGIGTDDGQFIDGRVTLQLSDGSEVVAYGAEGAVSATQSMRSDGSSSYTFASEVDPGDVMSVTLEGTAFTVDGEEARTLVLTPTA